MRTGATGALRGAGIAEAAGGVADAGGACSLVPHFGQPKTLPSAESICKTCVQRGHLIINSGIEQGSFAASRLESRSVRTAHFSRWPPPPPGSDI
jgi:hypothetical protein